MQILLNGNEHSLADGTTLILLLQELKIESNHVVIEHNRSIVPQPQFATTTLKKNDEVEIIHFVGGG